MKNIYLIAGKSGTGKDTIVNVLCNRYGYTRVTSYTTRSKRDDGKDHLSHEFVDMSKYRLDRECGRIMAETFYNGNYYWVTKEQIDNSDLYIIDIKGIEILKERYRGKGIVVIGIEADDDIRIVRMKARGDSLTSIAMRMETDKTNFKELGSIADYMVTNNNSDPGHAKTSTKLIADRINRIIQFEESKADADTTSVTAAQTSTVTDVAPTSVPQVKETQCTETDKNEDERYICPLMRPTRRDKSEALTGIMQALQGYGDDSMVPISRRLLCEVADILQNRI